ncbi:MAG: low molecular weight protein-tyrosine-phosphatase [Pseudomonadota bacterium]
MTERPPPRILFVCLGNICRSPLAEGAMRAAADREGFAIETDSAGTGDWHVGHPPDPRAVAEAARNGIDIAGLRGRQITLADFERFDHVIALDGNNLRDLRSIAPAGAAGSLSLLLDHAHGRAGQEVADPYFGDAAGFAKAWADISAGVEGLLAELRQPSR